MGWNELDKKTRKYVRNIAIVGGIALTALIGDGLYNRYNRHLCDDIAINAEAEQARDKTLEKHMADYCKDRRKSSNFDDCTPKIVSVNDCCAEVEYKLDKVTAAGKPSGCLVRTFEYEFNPVFEQWNDGDRLSQKTTDHKCSYRQRRRKKTWRDKLGSWVKGR